MGDRRPALCLVARFARGVSRAGRRLGFPRATRWTRLRFLAWTRLRFLALVMCLQNCCYEGPATKKSPGCGVPGLIRRGPDLSHGLASPSSTAAVNISARSSQVRGAV